MTPLWCMRGRPGWIGVWKGDGHSDEIVYRDTAIKRLYNYVIVFFFEKAHGFRESVRWLEYLPCVCRPDGGGGGVVGSCSPTPPFLRCAREAPVKLC